MSTLSPIERPAPELADMDTDQRLLIEIGWIIAGKLEDPDLAATLEARDTTRNWLRECFSQFKWRMPLLNREEIVRTPRVEPVELLEYGVTERNLRHWDLTLIVTPSDLVSHYKSDALSAVSRSLQSAVISTARIDPRAYRQDVSTEDRVRNMSQRIRALAIHCVGHLAGLEHVESSTSYMAEIQTVEDLDVACELSDRQVKQLSSGFREVADRRLEEQTDVDRIWKARFYLHASWINRRQIVEAVVQAKPWQFPFRLSRLTTAAGSAMLVLLISAEAWELALSQRSLAVTGLAIGSILCTTLYVLVQQRLFNRRGQRRLSELSVVTNVSTLAIVAAGMITSFSLLACATLLLGEALFGPKLVNSWTPSVHNPPDAWSHGKLAVFVASIGLFIGALGASFEEHHYFRHITYVDEEI